MFVLDAFRSTVGCLLYTFELSKTQVVNSLALFSTSTFHLYVWMTMYVIQETDRLLGQQYTDTDSGFYNKVIGVVFVFILYRYLLIY